MAVGLSLVGHLRPEHRVTLTEARDWLARAAVWFEAVGDAVLDTRLVRDAEDKPLLQVLLHPVADPVEIRIGGSGKVKVTTRTSPAGPGYHAHVCALFKQIAADFEFDWDEPDANHDPARYFVSEDRGRLERHFLHWLATTCTTALRDGPTASGIYTIGMPRQPKFRHAGPVLTPLGPKPVEWLREVSADPDRGIEFFAWWEPDLNATFFARRALTDLWLDFPWRAPLTDIEGELVDQIASDLANAHSLDPKAELPWTEWAAVVAAIENDTLKFTVEPVSDELKAEIAQKAKGQSAAEIGYRRAPISVPLTGGWHVEIPGSFAISRNEDGTTWTAWNDSRTVWFRDLAMGTDLSARDAVAAGRNNLPSGKALPRLQNGSVVGDAVFGPYAEDGRAGWRVCGVVAAEGHLATCNVYISNESDREWAIHTWESLGHDSHE